MRVCNFINTIGARPCQQSEANAKPLIPGPLFLSSGMAAGKYTSSHRSCAFNTTAPVFPLHPVKLSSLFLQQCTHCWAVRSTFITITAKQALWPNEAGCCLNQGREGEKNILGLSRSVCACGGVCERKRERVCVSRNAFMYDERSADVLAFTFTNRSP